MEAGIYLNRKLIIAGVQAAACSGRGAGGASLHKWLTSQECSVSQSGASFATIWLHLVNLLGIKCSASF